MLPNSEFAQCGNGKVCAKRRARLVRLSRQSALLLICGTGRKNCFVAGIGGGNRAVLPEKPASRLAKAFDDHHKSQVNNKSSRPRPMINAQAVNHIGIAVKSIADHRAFYEATLGARFETTEHVPSQKVNVAFFRVGDVRLELLEPTDPSSTIASFIEKRGEGLHHIAYTVADIDQRLAELKDAGVRLIDERPRPGAHHTRIAFLHPKSSAGVLTELCQSVDQ